MNLKSKISKNRWRKSDERAGKTHNHIRHCVYGDGSYMHTEFIVEKGE